MSDKEADIVVPDKVEQKQPEQTKNNFDEEEKNKKQAIIMELKQIQKSEKTIIQKKQIKSDDQDANKHIKQAKQVFPQSQDQIMNPLQCQAQQSTAKDIDNVFGKNPIKQQVIKNKNALLEGDFDEDKKLINETQQQNKQKIEILKKQFEQLTKSKYSVEKFANQQKIYPLLSKIYLSDVAKSFSYRCFLLVGMIRFDKKDLKSLVYFINNNKKLIKQNSNSSGPPLSVLENRLQILFKQKFQNFDQTVFWPNKNVLTEQMANQFFSAVKIIIETYEKNTLRTFCDSLRQKFIDVLIENRSKQWMLDFMFKMPFQIRNVKEFRQKILRQQLSRSWFEEVSILRTQKVFNMLIKYSLNPSDDLFRLTNQILLLQYKAIEDFIKLLNDIASNQIHLKTCQETQKAKSIISKFFKLATIGKRKSFDLHKVLKKMDIYNEFINQLIKDFVLETFLSLRQQNQRHDFYKKIITNNQIDSKNKSSLINQISKYLSNQQKYEILKKFYMGQIKSNYLAIDSEASNVTEAFQMIYKQISQGKNKFEFLDILRQNSSQIKEKLYHNKEIINKIHQQILTQFDKFFEIKSKVQALINIITKIKSDQLKQVKKELENVKIQLNRISSNKIKLSKEMQDLLQKVDLLQDIYSAQAFNEILAKNKTESEYSLLFTSLSEFQRGFEEKIQALQKDMTLTQFLNYFHKIGNKQLQYLLRKGQRKAINDKIEIGKKKLNIKRINRIKKFIEGVLFVSKKFNIEIKMDDFQQYLEVSKEIIKQLELKQDLLIIDINQPFKVTFQGFLEFNSKIDNLLRGANSKQKDFDKNVAVQTICAINQNKSLIDFSLELDEKKVENLMEFISQDQQQLIGTVKQLGSVVQYVKMVKSSFKSFSQLMIKTEHFVQKLYENKQIFKSNIENCGSVVNSLRMKLQQSSDQSFSFKHELQAINHNSKFYIRSFDGQNWKVVCKFYLDNKLMERNLDRLVQYREKTTIMNTEIYKSNANMDKQIQEKLKIFKNFHSNLEHLLIISDSIIQMIHSGYLPYGFISFNTVQQQMQTLENDEENYQEHLIAEIKEQQLNQISEKAQRIKENKKKWVKFLSDIWKQSFLACSLDGRRLRNIIVNTIIKNQFDPILKFVLGLPESTILEIDKEDLKCFLKVRSFDTIVSAYKQFFIKMKKYESHRIDKNPLSQPFKIFFDNKELNFYKIIFKLEPRVTSQDVLFCSQILSSIDIQRFLERSNKSNKKSFIVNANKLSSAVQSRFLNKIKSFNEDPNKTLLKCKLVFLQNRNDSKIYQTLTSRHYKFEPGKLSKLDLNLSQFKQVFRNCRIVSSQKASDGKSFYILNEIQKTNKRPKFFTLSGQIKIQQICKQINDLNLKKHQSISKNDEESGDALVIQVGFTYNPLALNEILAQILLFRSLKKGQCIIQKHIPIYVELTNTYDYNHFDKLPILQLVREFKDYTIQIPEFNIQNIELKPTKQNLYVYEMLNLIFTKNINTKQFKQVTVIQQNFKEILNQYLFKPLESKKQFVTGFIYSNFIKILYDNFLAFNQGFFDIKILEFMGFKVSSRSEILQIIIKNTIDFLKEYIVTTAYNSDKKSEQDFRSKLKNLGLLICPSSGGGFSFIFNDISYVPQILKKYMISQQVHQQNFNINIFKQLFQIKSMPEQKQIQQMKKRLGRIIGKETVDISQTYKLTNDNFFKLCVILYRINSNVPVMLMGQSGVGKTSLIVQLAKMTSSDMKILQVHAGKRKKQIDMFVKQIIQEFQISSILSKDEFNPKSEDKNIEKEINQKKNIKSKSLKQAIEGVLLQINLFISKFKKFIQLMKENIIKDKKSIVYKIRIKNPKLNNRLLNEQIKNSKLLNEQIKNKIFLNKFMFEPVTINQLLKKLKINDFEKKKESDIDLEINLKLERLLNLLLSVQQKKIMFEIFDFDDSPKKLLVFIDQYNTTEQIQLFKQLIIDRRYKNNIIPSGIIFIGCCNPYRLNNSQSLTENDGSVGLHFKRSDKRQDFQKLSFKVNPPPQSLRQATWDFQQLQKEEILKYSKQILKLTSSPQQLASLVTDIHLFMHQKYGRSSASLRDVERLRIIYSWCYDNLPKVQYIKTKINQSSVAQFSQSNILTNLNQNFQERCTIVSLCCCYVSKAQSQAKKQYLIKIIAQAMNKSPQQIEKHYDAQQTVFLKLMYIQQKIAKNKALKENVFLMIISIMNKLAFLIVGVPGCSKSLSVSLIQNNLRGPDSKSSYFQKLPEVRFISFQASQTCTSEEIESVFDRAEQICKSMKKYNIIYVVMIDEIGLAEYSPDNPLKVLHSKLQLNQKLYSVVAISNWVLDSAKTSRFLVCSRTLPSMEQINDTSIQLLKAYIPKADSRIHFIITTLSRVFCQFLKQWRQNKSLNKGYPQFFGLRDKYSFEKSIFSQMIEHPKKKLAQIINQAIKINFDGQERSLEVFLQFLHKEALSLSIQELIEAYQIGYQIEPIQQCQIILNTENSRCIMLIIPSDVLLPALSKRFERSICIHGSCFQADFNSNEYNLKKVAQITSYIAEPNLIVLKNINQVIYTSLYDLFNKHYTTSGDKMFCRVASGAYIKSRVQVNKKFNAIVFVNEKDIVTGNVDSAFLNRFSKVYFKIQRFLVSEELQLVQQIKQWISINVSRIVSKNSVLNKAHFFVNCSDNALYSMALDIRDQPCGDKLDIMKSRLLENTTFDYEMASIMSNIRRPIFGSKQQIKLKTKNEIIFTCDMEAEHSDDFLFYEEQNNSTKHRNIIMSMIKKQKQFEEQVRDFFSNKTQSVLKIKTVYEKEQALLNQIFFKIDEITKTEPQSQNKRVIIQIFVKRHQLKPSFPCVSYMYPYRQRFLSIIPKKKSQINDSELTKIQKSKNYLEFYEACKGKLQKIPKNYLLTAIKRIKPIFTCQNQIKKEQLKNSWYNLSRELQKNKFFQQFLMQMAQDYCKKKIFSKAQFEMYLKDNDIFTRSLSHLQSYSRYAQKILEDVITQIIIAINNQNIFFQFDRRKLIEFYKEVDVKFKNQYLQNQSNLNKMLIQIAQIRQFIPFNGIIKRQVQSNSIIISIPTLFPFSYSQGKRYLKQVKDGANYDQGQQEIQNDMIFENKVKELFIISTTKNEENIDAMIKSEINSLKKRFRQASIFTLMKIDEQTYEKVEVISMLDELENKTSKLSHVIQFYLYDFINIVYQGDQGEQTIYQIFRLLMDKITYFSLAEIFIIALADKETMKYLSKMLYSIRMKGYVFNIPDPQQKLNASIYLKYVIKVFTQNYLGKESYLKNPKQLFSSTSAYVEGLNDITTYLKLMQSQSYLQISIPNVMALLNKWIQKVQDIYKEKEKMERIVEHLLESNQTEGIFYSIVAQSSQILSAPQTDRSSKAVQNLQQFIGTTVFLFWYSEQIIDIVNDQESDSLVKVKQYFEKLKELTQISDIVASSLNATWSTILDVYNQEIQRGISQIDQHQENETPRLRKQVKQIINSVLSNSESKLNISLSNFAYYYYKTIIDNQIQQQDQKEYYDEHWKAAYRRVEVSIAKKKFENFLNDLSSIINFSFLKFSMNKYISYLKNEEVCDFINNVNSTLVADTLLSDHLGFYGLKLIRLNFQSIGQLIDWIKEDRAPWMKRKKFHFCLKQKQNVELRDPPTINVSASFKNLVAQLVQFGFNPQKLQKIGLYEKNAYEIYWLLTVFMKELYAKKNIEARTKVTQNIKLLKLPHFAETLVLSYAQNKISEQFEIRDDKKLQQQYLSQLPYLNIINWFIAIHETQNPLVNSFMENGQIPANYKQFLDNRHVVCGMTSQVRNIVDYYRKTNDRSIGIYKCSTNCDYIFTYENCGYPASTLKCQICGSQIGGSHHLAGLDRGSKRLGPCLYYDFQNKRFTPERHQSQVKLYVHSHLRNHETYWKSFPWYMMKQAIEISNKKETRLSNNQVLKLSGYRDQLTIEQLNQMQRIHQYSKYMLRLISCSFMYFASKLNIISQKQIEETFKKSKIRFQDSQYEQMTKLYSQIKKSIDDVIPWTLGITKEIFLLASNYTNQCDKLNLCRKKQLQELIDEGIVQKNQKTGVQKQLIDEIIGNLKTFQAEIVPVWQTKNVQARENFEIMVDSMVSKILSAEGQIDFIRKNQVVETDIDQKNPNYSNDAILKQLVSVQFLKDQFCVIEYTSLVRPLPEERISHIDGDDPILNSMQFIKCYENEIQQYPLLYEIVKSLQSTRILQDYFNIMLFVSKLTSVCDRKIERHVAKQMSLKQFLMNMKDPKKTQLQNLFKKFEKSWINYMNIEGKQAIYGCKNLGQLSPLNQNYKLNYFLPDYKQDIENVPGIVIIVVLASIANNYNRILTRLTNKIDKKKISSIILDPSKAEPHQIIKIDIPLIQAQIRTYTNYNIVYGKTVASVSYGKVQEKIEQKLFSSCFKFKTNMKSIRNIIFQGENMLSEKYSNCLQDLKRSPNQIVFTQNQQNELKEYFYEKQTQNVDGFYNDCRDILDELQIIIIYQENFKSPGQKTISEFILENKLKNQVEKVYKHRRYPQIKMKNLVALYQSIEDNIDSKVDLIIPEQYKVDNLTADEKRQIENDIKTLKNNKQQGQINFTLFYKAIKRMIFRRMLSFDPTMVNQQIGYNLTRLDYWPKQIQEEHLALLITLKIKITAFYQFFLFVKARSPQKIVMTKVQVPAEVVDTTKIQTKPPKKKVGKMIIGKVQI